MPIFGHMRLWPKALPTGSPWSATAVLLFLALAIGVLFNVRRWNDRDLLRWDSDCYYLYLPAAFIHHDLRGMRWLQQVPPGRGPEGYRFGYGLQPGKDADLRCYKCTLGVALSELPFFLVAHAWMRATDPARADGYAPVYHLSVGVASAVWATLGLLVLARFLRRRCSDAASATALLALGLGTNLFFYASYAGGMAHPWLFFLTALLLERTDRWHTHQHLRDALLIGAVLGLAVLTRPTLALLALVPLCWNAAAPRLLLRHAPTWALAAAVGALCLLPQLLYWKATTGHWLHYSYGDEGFDLSQPHVLAGLFSYRKGWFVYTPLALIALAGLVPLARSTAGRSYARTLLLFGVPFLYITFSWTQWWYGGSFGSRPLIDVLPLLAWPLAALVERAWRAATAWRVALAALLLGCIALNLFQQWQYKQGLLLHDGMDAARYWAVFGRLGG